MLYRYITLALITITLSMSVQAAKDHYSDSFRLEDGLILLKMQVNGRSGWFVFDTGAPGMVLNSRYFQKDVNRQPEGELSGIHGKISSVGIGDWRLRWNDLERSGDHALICDLSYLENCNRNEQILGLVGLEVFQGYYVKICFKSQILSIIKSRSPLLDRDKYQKIPIRKKENLLTVEMGAGAQKISLIVDTGSESNILDQSVLDNPGLTYKKTGEMELVGGDGNIVLADEVRLSMITLREEELYNQIFLVSELSTLNDTGETKIHGILGRPFFANRSIIIDRAARFIYVSDDDKDGPSPGNGAKQLARTSNHFEQ